MGYPVVKAFSRSVVELMNSAENLAFGELAEVATLGDVLPQQTVGVLVRPRCHAA